MSDVISIIAQIRAKLDELEGLARVDRMDEDERPAWGLEGFGVVKPKAVAPTSESLRKNPAAFANKDGDLTEERVTQIEQIAEQTDVRVFTISAIARTKDEASDKVVRLVREPDAAVTVVLTRERPANGDPYQTQYTYEVTVVK